jgi:hypothetical protein
MIIKDHNQIPRRFDFKHYLKIPESYTAHIAQCWFSREKMFNHISGRRDDAGTVAVYKLINFNSHVLVSNALSLSADQAIAFAADVTPESWMGGSIAYPDTVYQGVGYYVKSIPLTLMVEERLASINDMTVNPDWLDFNEKDLPLDIIEELQRYKLL